MKMNWLFFLGFIVVLAGASIIVKALFHVEVPLVRSAFALLLIFLGVRMLSDAWLRDDTVRVDRGGLIQVPTSQARAKYDVVFAKNTIDLTSLRDLDHDVFVEVNAVFGDAQVRVPAGVSYEVDASAAFGAVSLPQRSANGFGQQHDQRVVPSSRGRIRLQLNAVFGNCVLVEEPPPGGPQLAPGVLSGSTG